MARRSYSTYSSTELCAFWGMVISGFAYLFSGIMRLILGLIGEISPATKNLLNTIVSIVTLLGNLAIIFAIAIPAWQLVKYRSKGWKVVYWIALIGFALGVVLGLLGNLGVF